MHIVTATTWLPYRQVEASIHHLEGERARSHYEQEIQCFVACNDVTLQLKYHLSNHNDQQLEQSRSTRAADCIRTCQEHRSLSLAL